MHIHTANMARSGAAALAAIALGLVPQALGAATLQAAPLRIEVDPARPIAQLTLRNGDAQDCQIQIILQEWSQPDGTDRLVATRDLLANPPIFTLPGSAAQVVRLALRAPPRDVERSYRVIVQQLPQRTAAGQAGVGTLLRLSIPVFVPPLQRVVQVGWQVRPTASGLTLVMTNAGTVHVQVRTLRLTVAGRVVFDRALNAYALPGATRDVPIEATGAIAVGAPVEIEADTDQGMIKTAIPVQTATRVSGSG